MEFKGTKGRWIVRHSISKNSFNVIGTVAGGKYKIARVPYVIIGEGDDKYDKFNNLSKSEAEHDSKLIAAAPLLLKEHQMDLKHMLTWRKELINSGLRGSTLFCEYEDMIDSKKKAIEKALK